MTLLLEARPPIVLGSLALVVVLVGCGGDESQPAEPPLGRMSFEVPLNGCNFQVLGGECEVNQAEVVLVDVDATTPCIHYRKTFSAIGSQVIEGVPVEEGQRYELIVLLYCTSDPGCPRCFGRKTLTVGDGRKESLSLTPNPVVGNICPPVTLLTNRLDCR